MVVPLRQSDLLFLSMLVGGGCVTSGVIAYVGRQHVMLNVSNNFHVALPDCLQEILPIHRCHKCPDILRVL